MSSRHERNRFVTLVAEDDLKSFLKKLQELEDTAKADSQRVLAA